MQLKGLKYHDDISQRMPRAEVAEISQVVRKAATQLFPKLKLIIETCGSYRRGKEMSGDVDVLISVDSQFDSRKVIDGMLEQILQKLEKENFIKDRLTANRQSHHGS